jgi:aryl-alcohol dehydrogenase-like predicted oxidoreductase
VEYRNLGRSGLKVSTIALGTANFGGASADERWGPLETPEARRFVDIALDAGVNLLDTADVYSGGASETMLGEVVSGRRDELLIATKVRFRSGPGPNDVGLSRHHILRSCEASLRRLHTDWIDLYQVHDWDGMTPLEETLEALNDLVRMGKVRYLGCSNYAAWQLLKALGIAERRGFDRFVSQQIYYSVLNREAEHELLPASVEEGLGNLIWSPLAGGLLTGKYRRNAPPPSIGRHLSDWPEPPISDWEHVYDVVDAIVSVAESRGATPAQVTLSYSLGTPGVTSVVVGARTENQLRDTLAASDIVLERAERGRLDTASATPLPYPMWHLVINAPDRMRPIDRWFAGLDRGGKGD